MVILIQSVIWVFHSLSIDMFQIKITYLKTLYYDFIKRVPRFQYKLPIYYTHIITISGRTSSIMQHSSNSTNCCR